MKSARILLVAAVANAVAAAPAGGQTPYPVQANPGGLLVDRDRPDRQPETVQPGGEGPMVTAPEGAVPPSFILREATVEGSRLPPERLRAALDPFIGRSLDAQGLAKIQQAVSAAYAGSDWALPIVTLDTSGVDRGVLRLVAIEGYVDRVAIDGQVAGDVELLRHYAAALAGEAPLSRRTAERYFSLIGDIPGAKVATSLRPGQAPGAADLGLTLERTRWEVGYGIDTRGSSSLGRTQLIGSAALNGAFRLGDQTRLTAIVPADVERFQYVGASHRRPMGWDGAAITGSVGYLRTRPPGAVAGDAVNAGVQYSWPMVRGYRTNVVLSGGLDGVNSDSALFGERIATERTRVLRASAAWSRTTPRMAASASATASRGIDGLGARAVAALTDLEFAKINLRAAVTRMVGERLRLTASAAAQHSPDRAPATEQFTLGGGEFGRAFPAAVVAGDSGWGLRGEAAWKVQGLRGPLAGSELYAFGDGGQVRQNARPGLQLPAARARLASAGVGARIQAGRKAAVEVEAARVVSDPRLKREDWRLNFGLTARF